MIRPTNKNSNRYGSTPNIENTNETPEGLQLCVISNIHWQGWQCPATGIRNYYKDKDDLLLYYMDSLCI